MDHKSVPTDSLSVRIFRNDPQQDSLPQSISLSGLLEELTALRKENATLQQTLRLTSGLRQRFEQLYDSSPLGFMTIDADDRIIEANLTLTNLLQTTRAKLIGQHVGNFIAASDHAHFIHHLTALRDPEQHPAQSVACTLSLHVQDSRTGQPAIKVKLESILQPDSTYASLNTIQVSITPLDAGPADNPQCLENLAETNAKLQKEILERQLAEEKTQQHQERLTQVARLNTMGEMASGLAHEINQPLTAISSYTASCLRLLKGDLEQQAKVPKILQQVLIQSRRAVNIIQHLRDFVSRTTRHREPTDLARVMDQAIAMLRNDISKNSIELSIDAGPDLPLIKADAIQIEQVLLNLLRNATEALKEVPAEARRIHITMDVPSSTHVRIAISDSGPGISTEDAEKIATPFFSTKESGMGLGLAISRTIVEDHGGSLSHTSNAEGGSTFTFTLKKDDVHKSPGHPAQD